MNRKKWLIVGLTVAIGALIAGWRALGPRTPPEPPREPILERLRNPPKMEVTAVRLDGKPIKFDRFGSFWLPAGVRGKLTLFGRCEADAAAVAAILNHYDYTDGKETFLRDVPVTPTAAAEFCPDVPTELLQRGRAYRIVPAELDTANKTTCQFNVANQ